VTQQPDKRSGKMNRPIEIELSKNGENLYVFFGGIAAGIAMPPLEFYNASKIIDEHKIFIRDFSQCWYQDGLYSVGDDIYSSAEKIKEHIENIKPVKLYFVGNSMGGYAAILFSCLIGAGEVIAFAPQTFISPLLRMRHGDRRWSRNVLRAYRKSFLKPKVWNLKPLMLRSNHCKKVSIFVSTEDKLV